MLKNKIMKSLQYILFFIIVYLVCTRFKNKYEVGTIIALGVVALLKNFYNKEYLRIDRKIFYIIFFWILIITLSFFKMLKLYPSGEGEYIVLYKNMMIYNFLLFFVLTQIEFEKFRYKERILDLINILSLYPVYKGVIYIKDNGIFKIGVIYGHQNYYSMLIGIFSIISFGCFCFEKNKIYKLLYLCLNILQLFVYISVGQSRNVFLALCISYISCLILFNWKENRKRVFKILLFSLFIVSIGIFILKLNNLRVVDISVEKFLNDPRILIWKKCLIDEKFNLFFGKGFAYYIMNKFKDSVGVTIWALHNDSLEFLVTQGIFSMLLYWGFIFYFIKSFLVDFLHTRNKMSLITFILVLYFFMIGMLDLPFYSKRISQFIFLFLGMNIHREKRKIKDEKKYNF